MGHCRELDGGKGGFCWIQGNDSKTNVLWRILYRNFLMRNPDRKNKKIALQKMLASTQKLCVVENRLTQFLLRTSDRIIVLYAI